MAQKIKLDEENNLLVSTEMICKLFDVSRAALKKWRDGGCPQIQRGWFDLREVLKWKGENSSGKIDKNTSSREKKLYYEAKYKEEQVRRIELKNAIAEGAYLSREEAESELKRLLVVLKTSLVGLGNAISTEVSLHVDSETARLLDKNIQDTIYDALEQMSIDGIYNAKKRRK